MKRNLLLIIPLFIASCTSFDSNKLNKKLIQGGWRQVETTTYEVDSIFIDKYDFQHNSLFFRGDSCIERLTETSEKHYFLFDIQDYILILNDLKNPISYLTISKLTKDSLILYSDNKVLRYKKNEE